MPVQNLLRYIHKLLGATKSIKSVLWALICFVGIYGHLWIFVNICDHLWTILVICEHLWTLKHLISYKNIHLVDCYKKYSVQKIVKLDMYYLKILLHAKY